MKNLEKRMVYHGAHPHFLPIVTENFNRLQNDSTSSFLAAVQMYAYPNRTVWKILITNHSYLDVGIMIQ